MSVKTLCRCSLQFSVCMFTFLFLMDRAPLTAAFAGLWYCMHKNGRKPAAVLAVLLVLLYIPRYSEDKPAIDTGRVIQTGENYCIVQNGRTRVLLYTKAMPLLDSEIRWEGVFEPVRSASGFYRFSFAAWAQNKGIRYCCTAQELTAVKTHATLRALIQKRISAFDDFRAQRFLYRVLLNISVVRDDSFLMRDGFSLAGILLVSESVLELFLTEKKRRKVMLVLHFLAAVFFRFPLLVTMRFVSKILSCTKLSSSEKLGITLCIILLVYRTECLSTGFVIAALYRLTMRLFPKDRYMRRTVMLGVQSLCFHSMDIVRMVLYPVTLRISGIFWLAGIFQLFFPFLPMHELAGSLDLYESILKLVSLPGTLWGSGLPMFLILCSYIPRPWASWGYLALLLLFQFFGLFHPCAELTCINVGQGDAILLRQPFSSCDCLIDTGKPEQEDALHAYLQAKGIRRLQSLFITHEDSDHSGNRKFVEDTYHPAFVYDSHFDTVRCGKLQIIDLNTIEDEDANRSCLVLYTSVGGKKILLMGDADQYAEEKIIYDYGALKCDILKAGHHGSKTSSGDLFLDHVHPEIALISSGAYAIYHHPSPETVQSFLKRHIPYFDTKTEGDISVFFLFGHAVLLCSSGTFAIF